MRRAFTLIELLIVVGIISILTPAFFTAVIFVTRQEVEVRIGATLRQEGLSVVRAVMRDAHLAHTARVSTGEAETSGESLILEMAPITADKPRQIAYRRLGPRLERLVWENDASTPAVQALSVHVRSWRIERAGDLAHVDVELAISRYAKEFTEKYGFTVRIGEAFGGVGEGRVAPANRPQSESGRPVSTPPGKEGRP